MSRIGRKPIDLPKEVKVEVKDGLVSIEGPKGKLSRIIPEGISLEVQDGKLLVKCLEDSTSARCLQGLKRTLILNMLKGVSDGYVKELEIIGVGFKAQVQGDNLNLQLGFSHPVNFPIPEGIKIETPRQTQIIIRGIDKEKVGEVAAELRAIYPPEPYKGKGIRYAGEYVKRKVGKAQATQSK